MARLTPRRASRSLAGCATLALVLGAAPHAASAAPSALRGDFNGDGRADLVMPVSLEDLTGTDEGVVHVLAGSTTGPRARGNQLWSEAALGVADDPADGERFGAVTASGDFDGDGFADLVIAAPGEETAGAAAGAVYALSGSPFGLYGDDATRFLQGEGGLGGVPEAGDGFGTALAVGDFNADGRDDVAVGVPGESLRAPGSGMVVILSGSADGLRVGTPQRVTQSTVGGLGEDGDAFGAALAAGDFNADGYDDLAIGAPGETLETTPAITEAGAVYVATGSANGLRGAGRGAFHQSLAGMNSRAEALDHFGAVLAAGDLDADGCDDLVIGVPDESFHAVQDGLVQVLKGSRTTAGLTVAGNQRLSQDGDGIPDTAEDFDRFGAALTVGPFDDTAGDDVVVGIPGESYAGVPRAGAVLIVAGARAKQWTQDSTNVLDVPEVGDEFGTTLWSADLNGDGRDDLVVGVPSEDLTLDDSTIIPDVGAVHVLFGAARGLTAAGNQLWTQDSPRVLDSAEAGDGLGQ